MTSPCAIVATLFLLTELLLQAPQASARVIQEDIGELKIHDLLIRPNFSLREPQSGAFSMGESSFALRWELESKYSGVVRIGPRSLMNPIARFKPEVNDDVMLVEAFAEYTDAYGRFRLGRLPIDFGYEGRQWERDLIFPRQLLFEKRAMMLRDVGAAYEVNHNGFYTGFVIHNGESESDEDGRIWYTAHWGYLGENFEVGVAGQTGTTKPSATALSQDTLAGVDPTAEALWRIGGVYGVLHKKHWEWVLEIFAGEREQEERIGKFSSGHADVSWEISRFYSLHLRYDQFDPNLKTYGDLERRGSLAFVMSNKTHSSNLIVVGSKNIEQGASQVNDELRLIWSLSPSGVVRF